MWLWMYTFNNLHRSAGIIPGPTVPPGFCLPTPRQRLQQRRNHPAAFNRRMLLWVVMVSCGRNPRNHAKLNTSASSTSTSGNYCNYWSKLVHAVFIRKRFFRMMPNHWMENRDFPIRQTQATGFQTKHRWAVKVIVIFELEPPFPVGGFDIIARWGGCWRNC